MKENLRAQTQSTDPNRLRTTRLKPRVKASEAPSHASTYAPCAMEIRYCNVAGNLRFILASPSDFNEQLMQRGLHSPD
ncbi:hypothetical protein Bca4012_009463 [Brassica carinata]